MTVGRVTQQVITAIEAAVGGQHIMFVVPDKWLADYCLKRAHDVVFQPHNNTYDVRYRRDLRRVAFGRGGSLQIAVWEQPR